MEDLFNSSGKIVGLVKRAEAVIGTDDLGRTVGLVNPPTFCDGSTEDEIEAAHNGSWHYGDGWDLSRHKDASNPGQCETARQYDLATDRWYRESPASLLKNMGAGIINGIIPGSDLGDAGSSTQILGQLIGGVASLFVSPGQIVTKLANMSLGTTLGNAINFVNKAFSGPIGTISANVIGSMLTPTPALPAAASQQVYSATQPAALADSRPLSYAQQALFGSSPANKLAVQTSNLEISTGSKVPLWAWIAGGVSLLITVLTLIISLRKKGKR